jgi:hypothetical protein
MTWEDEDRRFVIAAAEELDEYLSSTQLTWRLSKSAGMLTPGNLLLCLNRSSVVDSFQGSRDYQIALETITRILERHPAIWEKRIAMEIPYRTRLWQNAIQECKDEGIIDATIKTDLKNRVILESLMDETRSIDAKSQHEMVRTDALLKSISSPGDFLWDISLINIFPQSKFWYLYLQTGSVKK